MQNDTDALTCPRCHGRGHSVKPKTLDKLLTPAARAAILDPTGWAFCDTPSCPTVYFPSSPAARARQERLLEANDLSVPVGVKRTSAPRPLCYCFDHSIESLELEHEPSRVLDQIKQLMKTDGCRCVSTNPQGRCCLATVQAAIEVVQAEAGR